MKKRETFILSIRRAAADKHADYSYPTPLFQASRQPSRGMSVNKPMV